MAKFNDFKSQTIKQIRLWAWAAAVLPISALAGIFFTWRFYDSTIFGYAMIIGETTMFAVAVTWWWWAMYVLRNLVQHWDDTRENVKSVLHDVKSIRQIVMELLGKDK
jgi:high-affinity Fe2+/Pb2+ permease